MKKNILLTVVSAFIAILFVEYVIGPNWLKNHHDIPDKVSVDLYKKYYKRLHHLRHFEDWYYKNGLIYSTIGEEHINNDFKSTVLINGDSWAENLLVEKGITNQTINEELIKIKKKKKINIINSGTSSYSFSPTTVQLKILRNDFNINPDKIISIIDHTDVGDEICRYKDMLEFDDDKNLINVRPEDKYSAEVFTVERYLSKAIIYTSNDFNIVKFIKNKIFRKDIKDNRKYDPICTFTEIMRPIEIGLNENEYTYLKEVTLRYIDTVFDDKNVEKLLFVVHPHMKHFTKEYNFYFGDFLKEILQENINKDKIVLLDFKEIFYEVYFKGDKSKNYKNIFVSGDAASHLNLSPRVIFIKKAFNKL